jgi:hypothetical protein
MAAFGRGLDGSVAAVNARHQEEGEGGGNTLIANGRFRPRRYENATPADIAPATLGEADVLTERRQRLGNAGLIT